ncbi:hypothetical protein [Cysteiniphilum litorale]|uniref:hypothetical protein n=1 Tax=Cysteiniphilum litorale TaxID=2056700 RepID=UPI003F881889
MYDKTKVGRIDKSKQDESVFLEQTLSTDEISKLIERRRNIISGRVWGIIVLWWLPLAIAFFWSLQAGHLIIFALAIAIPVAIAVAGILIILMLITSYFTYKDELKQIDRIQAANQALWQQISLEPRKSLLKTHIRSFIKDYLKAIITILVIMIACVIYFVRESHILTISDSSGRMQKLAQSLETQYGERFQVTKEAYNPESNGYSYTVIPQSMPDTRLVVITDFLGKGSSIGNYLQTRSAREAVALVQPFFDGLSDIYRVRASGGALSTLELPEEQAYLANKALDNLYGSNMHIDQWISSSHDAMNFGVSARVDMKKTPENLWRLIHRMYALNHYLLTFKFFSYHIEVYLLDIPKASKLKAPMSLQIFGGAQSAEAAKYTWAVLRISQCTINGVMKYCYDNQPNIPQYANIGKNIHTPLDIAKLIKLIPTHSVKAKLTRGIVDSWAISRRYDSEQAQFLVNTPLYQQVVKLTTTGEDL